MINVNDMNLARKHFAPFFSNPENLPISYEYGGVAYRGFPFDSSASRRIIDANIIETVFIGKLDDNMCLYAECLTYKDCPAAEWTVWFNNTGGGNSLPLSSVKAADCFFGEPSPTVAHCNGDFYHADGYTQQYTALRDGAKLEHAPTGGRPSDGAFPYYRILCEGYGFAAAIGWPGQWSASFEGKADGFIFSAGQQTANTYLKPGESFRTPRMTLLAFAGDEARGINVWRRFMNAHVTPRKNGRILDPRIAMCENAGGLEFTLANEQNQLEAIKFVKESGAGANLWWIDAGWYPCPGSEWWVTGTWKPDPARFPNGLKPVGDAAHDAGMEFLVWFEPERIQNGTWLETERPQWLLKCQGDSSNHLLNITDPDCFKWLCETVSSLIKESGINCYRQDFNFPPLAYWTENSGPGREGMLENQYVQAYLAYWDFLLNEIPGLWIDSCSSGGRRNDLETMRRAVPLHPTDYGYGLHHINQAFRRVLCQWIPYTRGFVNSWDADGAYSDSTAETPYDGYKAINGMGVLSWVTVVNEMQKNPETEARAKIYVPIWKKFADLMLSGDYYALTPDHRDFSKWTVFQFNRPETGEGALQCMRNPQSKEDCIKIVPHGLLKDARYLFTQAETGETFAVTGKEAETGIELCQPARSGAIWFYKNEEIPSEFLCAEDNREK
ncbi:MAG: alpha-galactosidase [Defluviitaleaceae bacterium]|nr:alpha-galactosidase [Defluviitaleaceae bacterium]